MRDGPFDQQSTVWSAIQTWRTCLLEHNVVAVDIAIDVHRTNIRAQVNSAQQHLLAQYPSSTHWSKGEPGCGVRCRADEFCLGHVIIADAVPSGGAGADPPLPRPHEIASQRWHSSPMHAQEGAVSSLSQTTLELQSAQRFAR
jgi:hypothetical protein